MSTVIPIPSYCIVNVRQPNREWEYAGSLKDCWDILMIYKSVPVSSILAIGWRIVPLREARNLKPTVAA